MHCRSSEMQSCIQKTCVGPWGLKMYVSNDRLWVIFFSFFSSLYEFYTHAHRVIGVRIKPPSHEANMKALLGRETRNLEKNPS